MATILYGVVPCYNEEEVLPLTAKVLRTRFVELIAEEKISAESKIMFVDDGSKDQTWEIIAALHQEDAIFAGIRLTRNRGHQDALLCGLLNAADYADAVISLDADLQDDISVLDEFVDQYEAGCQIVYGVRSDRTSDTFLKRFTAQSYYKLMRLFGVELVYNHADYRLMGSEALNDLREYSEVNLFLRGLVSLLGYTTGEVHYVRQKRAAGESKYNPGRMLALAWEGLSSFSIRPIRMISGLGVFIFFVSIVMLVYTLICHYSGNTVAGWSSMTISIWAIGGIQLLAIGIIGEYIGKIYLESKRRPRYAVRTLLCDGMKRRGRGQK